MTTLKETVETDIQYSAWATRRLLDASAELSPGEQRRQLEGSHGSVLRTLHHIYVSERFWTECLLANRIPPLHEIGAGPAPDEMQLEELTTSWPSVWADQEQWLSTATDAILGESLACQISAESQFNYPRWQVVRHSVNHGTLHRGQIVSMLRALGNQPPSVDYMAYLLR